MPRLEGQEITFCSSGRELVMDPTKEMLSPNALVGQIINRYKISQRISTSGVFLAFKEDSPERQVALKVFYPNPFADNHDVILERLQAVSQLDHENIVKVYEVGDVKDFLYAVMEYVPGENLYNLMQRNPRLHWAAAAELARDIVRGLVAAHAKKVIHRCLHPDKVLLGKGGQVKINFCNEGEITPSKEIVQYVPPELFLGKELEESSDIYALGAIICNIVTGNPPMAGKEPKDVAKKHRELCPVLPNYGVADIPHTLSLILARSLDINLQERYHQGFELEAALRNFLKNDIGTYHLGSYKELFRRVEISECDRAFTREVERVRRQKGVVSPVSAAKPLESREESGNNGREALQTKEKKAIGVKLMGLAQKMWERLREVKQCQMSCQWLEEYLGSSCVPIVAGCVLSLLANVVLALLLLVF